VHIPKQVPIKKKIQLKLEFE